jgi:surface protein
LNSKQLRAGRRACLTETPDGSCPLFSQKNGKIGQWDITHVKDNPGGLFHGFGYFNSDISKWNTSNIISMNSWFDKATNFNVDISGWDTARVADFTDMFASATSFNIDLSSWNVAYAVSLDAVTAMFNGATLFSINLCGDTWLRAKTLPNWRFMLYRTDNAQISDLPCSCSPGKHLWLQGTTSAECADCDAGKYQDERGFTLSLCRKNCSAGRYQDELGSKTNEDCKTCDEGRFSDHSGMISAFNCKGCSPGQYAAQMGSSTCLDCQSDTYSTQSSTEKCTACPAGWHTPNINQSNIGCVVNASPSPPSGSHPDLLIIIGLFLVFVLIVGVVVQFSYRTLKRQNDETLALQQHSAHERLLLETEIKQISEGRKINFQDLTLHKLLDKGAEGEVFKGTWRMLPEQYVAIKMLFLSSKQINDEAMKEMDEQTEDKEDDSNQNDFSWTLDKEISLLMRIKPHPRTVLFHGAGRVSKNISTTQTGQYFLVSEFMPNGNLRSALNKRLQFSQRVQIAADIAEGMKFLHSRQPPIIHRDLKCGNILLDNNDRAKIADFGLSKLKSEQSSTNSSQDDTSDTSVHPYVANIQNHQNHDMTKPAGTTFYMAPESFGYKVSSSTSKAWSKTYLTTPDKPVDVYSFGIIVLELITCRKAWKECDFMLSSMVIPKVLAGERPSITEEDVNQCLEDGWGGIHGLSASLSLDSSSSLASLGGQSTLNSEMNNSGALLLSLMKDCWKQKANERPTFQNVLKRIRTVHSVKLMCEHDRFSLGRTSDSCDSRSQNVSSDSQSSLNYSSPPSNLLSFGSSFFGSGGTTESTESGSTSGEEKGNGGGFVVERKADEGRARYSSFSLENGDALNSNNTVSDFTTSDFTEIS